jgi:type VI secretion system protein ImpJ
MTARAVHWHEGMFLLPHHFQAAQRHADAAAARGGRWDVHYNWGLRGLDLDADALANHRFVAHVLSARMRDGTLVSFPDDGALPPLDLRPAFEKGRAVTVVLGVPVARAGRATASAEPTDRARYLVETVELEDENTGVNPHPVEFRTLNARLMLDTDPKAGFETLPVARVAKTGKADSPPALDPAFIPPVLACDAFRPLAAGVLAAAADRIGTKIDVLATQATARGLTFDSRNQGELTQLEQLRELNEAAATLGVIGPAAGVHPLTAYTELCRVVGRLAVFGPTRRVAPLPRYDHDDLGGCFWRVKAYLDELLDLVVEPAYKERPFVGAGLRMQVSLEPSWIEPTWGLFIGVQSPLTAEECVKLLSRGQLDMKVGSSDRVDAVFRLGQAGLVFDHRPSPPRVLPDLPGQTYFQIAGEATHAEWQAVQRSLTLALRVNEHRVVGNIQGEKALTIRTGGGQTVPVQFTLYAVPQM